MEKEYTELSDFKVDYFTLSSKNILEFLSRVLSLAFISRREDRKSWSLRW